MQHAVAPPFTKLERHWHLIPLHARGLKKKVAAQTKLTSFFSVKKLKTNKTINIFEQLKTHLHHVVGICSVSQECNLIV